MINLSLKKCCFECEYPCLKTRESRIYLSTKNTTVNLCELYYIHAPVCKNYIESEDE